MNSNRKVYYFGYGANADSKWLEEIIGKKPIKKAGGIVFGYKLCIQTLQEIPQAIKELLKSTWGNDYLVYTLYPGKGIVVGIVWELDEEEFSKIKEWENIKEWRKLISIEVVMYSGLKQKAFTDIISSEAQPLFGCIDGINYPFILNKSPRKRMQIYKDEAKKEEKINKIRLQIQSAIKSEN